MAADTALGVLPPVPASSEQSNTLFTYEVAHDRRLITRLVGVALDREGRSVRVAAEMYPAHAPETSDPQWRFYDFPTREKRNTSSRKHCSRWSIWAAPWQSHARTSLEAGRHG